MEFTELDPTVLAELQSGRGGTSYKQVVEDFLASSVGAADVGATFSDRKPGAVSAGLKNAIRKHSIAGVEVRSSGSVVALIRS